MFEGVQYQLKNSSLRNSYCCLKYIIDKLGWGFFLGGGGGEVASKLNVDFIFTFHFYAFPLWRIIKRWLLCLIKLVCMYVLCLQWTFSDFKKSSAGVIKKNIGSLFCTVALPGVTSRKYSWIAQVNESEENKDEDKTGTSSMFYCTIVFHWSDAYRNTPASRAVRILHDLCWTEFRF